MDAIVIHLSSGAERRYVTGNDYSICTAFGVDEREGWLYVMRQPVEHGPWYRVAWFPPGSWVGMEGVEEPPPEAPRQLGFR